MLDADRTGRRRLSALPRQTLRALKMVWEAAAGDVGLAAGLQVVAGAALVVELLAGRSILGSLERGARDLGAVAVPLVVLGAAVVVAIFTAAALPERQRLLAERLHRHANALILDVVTDVELEAFDDPDFHDRLQRAMAQAEHRPQQLVFGLLSLAQGLTTVAGIGIAVLVVRPVFLALALVAFAPLWWVAVRSSRSAYEFSYALTSADRERAYLQTVLTGRASAHEVRAYRLGPTLRQRHERLWDERLRRLSGVVARRLRHSLVAAAATAAATMATVVVLVWMTVDGRLSVADAAVTAVAVQQLGLRLRSINNGTASIHECSLFLDDLTSFLDLAPELRAARPTGAAPAGFRSMQADGVGYRYPGAQDAALDGVSLHVDAGELVALVGENGSGKTTLAKVLCGLYRPTTGAVRWDGADTAGIDPDRVRANVAVVFQDFVRYELPAHDNIAAGRHERWDDRAGVERAAERAGAAPFLSSLPAGFDTVLSKAFTGGTDLSTGQWQRVALARAFFADAPFLVLDEPTAAIDARAEHELFESVRELSRGRAVLLISHRLASVRSADRIYVLHEGRVTETGDHDQLMAAGGRYAELFSLQAAAYREPV